MSRYRDRARGPIDVPTGFLSASSDFIDRLGEVAHDVEAVEHVYRLPGALGDIVRRLGWFVELSPNAARRYRTGSGALGEVAPSPSSNACMSGQRRPRLA